jgi:hypothetical protein
VLRQELRWELVADEWRVCGTWYSYSASGVGVSGVEVSVERVADGLSSDLATASADGALDGRSRVRFGLGDQTGYFQCRKTLLEDG